ncbi:MAG: DUF1800 domain-containing protein [Chloroflexi bacterium]|nr:DUF1800 domain-containing protein [Chloroflexota bacterium]MYK61164.1 DUF1800 domain-containing protein [Chloroflexota bacterium]
MTTAVSRDTDTALMAHLLRRAGFGATRDQIDEYVAKGYDETVEELLHPEYSEPEDQDLLDRYFIASVEARSVGHADPQWAWRMATTTKHLEEKIALFWHGLLAVGGIKLDHGMEMLTEIDLFRRYGLGKFRDILLEISRNPGMMYWLDNQNSHKGAPNENYGRELLELFSMGIDEMGEGAYTEDDVKAAARAFTGWASKPTMPPFFLGPFPMEFQFDPNDHDDGEKEFLGEVGNWNGEDIVEITVRQRATAEFISRRLYQFFVADEADEDEVQRLADVFEENDGEIRAVLRAIFKSDHFKSEAIRYRKVKSPTELVFGVARLTDRFDLPDMDASQLASQTMFMGQFLLNPPSVEGWHEGEEWIDSGALVERINFASTELERRDAPGIQRMVDLVSEAGGMGSTEYVAACLDAMGCIDISDRTFGLIAEHASSQMEPTNEDEETDRAIEIFQLIASTPDYQYC